MTSAACALIENEFPNLNNNEKNELINSWDNSKSAFENLLDTTWTFDPLVYKNVGKYRSLRRQYNYDRYNKLQILSNKVLISNLSTGFRDTGPTADGDRACSAGLISLEYSLVNEQVTFIDDSGNNSQIFKIRLVTNNEDIPSQNGNNPLWLKVTVDPLLGEDSTYRNIPDSENEKTSIRTIASQPIQGRRLKFELNFNIKDCGSTKNRFTTNGEKVSYWSRIKIKNMCEIDNSSLTNHAVLAKCLKYKAGNFNDNIKDLYNNLIVTAAKSKNIIRTDNFTGETCSHRNSITLDECNNSTSDTKANNENCARALNCGWDGSFERSMGSGDSTCEDEGTRCYLDSLNTLENSIENIKNSIQLYRSYLQHRNPYSNLEISEFGQTCDVNIINQIENVCYDKNIGISFRFEPISCNPSDPQFDASSCKASCGSNTCTTPVLVSEPNLSAFECSLEGLDQLEKYCKDINDDIINDPNYTNLGFTENQIKLPGYNPDNYPYTGCNESSVESHLLYIRSLIMGKLEEVNNRINSIIENDAEALNAYSKRKLERINLLKDDINRTQNEIVQLNQNVLATMTRIGRVNNDYNTIKLNIVEFNNRLDLRFERKKREFKVVVFFSILIINILIILIFFRKK